MLSLLWRLAIGGLALYGGNEADNKLTDGSVKNWFLSLFNDKAGSAPASSPGASASGPSPLEKMVGQFFSDETSKQTAMSYVKSFADGSLTKDQLTAGLETLGIPADQLTTALSLQEQFKAGTLGQSLGEGAHDIGKDLREQWDKLDIWSPQVWIPAALGIWGLLRGNGTAGKVGYGAALTIAGVVATQLLPKVWDGFTKDGASPVADNQYSYQPPVAAPEPTY